MRDLAESQHEIQDYLLGKNPHIPAQIITNQKVVAKDRIAIYQEGYYLRLLEVLQQDYEVLSAMLGAEAFDQLGRGFIKACPSHFRSVRWYGNLLPDYMRGEKEYQQQEWLIEMAEFEWTLMESFDAAGSSLLSLQEMAAVPIDSWPDMRFQCVSSLQRLNLHWNVVPAWKAFKDENAFLPPEKAHTAAHWIIWRKGLETLFHSLTPDAAYMIDAIRSGSSFGEICEGLCDWVSEEEVAMHAASLLKRFILDELIAEINY